MSFCTVKEVKLCVRARERRFIAAIGNRATAIANEIQQTELKIVFKMSENAAPLLLLVSGYFLELSIVPHILFGKTVHLLLLLRKKNESALQWVFIVRPLLLLLHLVYVFGFLTFANKRFNCIFS